MKSIVKFVLIFILFFFLSGCKKQGASYNVYFFTSSYDEWTPLYLFINDEPRGEIPYFSQKLSFDNDSLKSKALLLHLNYDNYPVVSKDKWGNLKNDASIKFKRKSISSNSVIGQIHTSMQDKDIIIEVNYK